MKRILPLLPLALLAACHSSYDSVDELPTPFALKGDWQETLPQQTVSTDKLVNIVLADTIPCDSMDNPTLPPTDDCIEDAVMVPLGRIPDFHIDNINRIESDDGLLFILAEENHHKVRDGKPYNTSDEGCFIFDRRGKCLAKVGRTQGKPKGKGPVMRSIQHMCLDRQRKEIVLTCFSMPAGEYLCYYNYKGKFLRRQAVHPASLVHRPQVTGNRLVDMLNIAYDSLKHNEPQLVLYDETGLPVSRALLRPYTEIFYHNWRSFASSRDGLYYAPVHSDTVWQITPDTTVARYVFSGPQVGNTASPYQHGQEAKAAWYLGQEHRICRYTDYSNSLFCVSSDFMFMPFNFITGIRLRIKNGRYSCGFTGHNMFCLLDRQTNHTRWLSVGRITALRDEFLFGVSCLTEDGQIVCYQTVEQLKRSAASEFSSYYITDKEMAFIKRLKMDDNPVLYLAKLKHF